MSASDLSPQQAHALFDILTHQETYSEIENFKWPDAIHKYGRPFTKEDGQPCTSPVLQMLLEKFILILPGLSSVSKDFWQVRVQTIVEKLGSAELSESYDKGSVGLRKTLATAISAVIEYPAKGALGGFPKKDVESNREYDLSKPEDIMQAWDDFCQKLVYGDMIDELFKKAAETNKLEDHSSLVRSAHQFIVVNLASLIHHILIISPDGQALLRLAEQVHRLIPYTIIRQTLKIGNAASMINAMMNVVLAKLSVGSVTNWLGISSGADEGQNLLQRIISTVLIWDSSELKKQAAKIEKSKGPDGKHLDALKDHLYVTRDEREKRRAISKEQSKSIVSVIFETKNLSTSLSETKQTQSLEYLSAQLAVRDREQIAQVLCHHSPDHLTQAIRDGVSAYDPIIRSVHQAADLSASLSDLENFLNDLFKLSKIPSTTSNNSNSKTKLPTVEDYVKLLEKHQSSLHRFLHQVAKNGPQVTEQFRVYAYEALSQFRRPSSNPDGAGAMNPSLSSLFQNISAQDREPVLKALDAHSEYLANLSTASKARMRSILNNAEKTVEGPGMYLAKWQSLIDTTPITPVEPRGPLRSGKSKDVKEAGMVDVDGEKKGGSAVVGGMGAQKEKVKMPDAPDVSVVVRALGEKYREMLAGGVS
ncbi:hypothetical protein K490DRAFT_30777 [Saccharata proteae CBS 121410]|uniref:PX-associated-domain-containing protein n=1 Tax=Saccharata proteae CBS 121410 TaxID=1314787 RepID=A0A9P4I2W6_9PEZI|nr:hypothetical protein K490DRAFT_30777 [Saccharata proteae CBS 121410]